VGTPLLHRRDGLKLTAAGLVLLDASRNVLSRLDHELSRTRQAAGLGRPRLRMIIPPGLPEALAIMAAAGLQATAAAADVDVEWLETALDAEFSLIYTRRADAQAGTYDGQSRAETTGRGRRRRGQWPAIPPRPTGTVPLRGH